MAKETSYIPFAFDATRRSGLADQMTEGLRQAIVTGRYKPGETLPTILEWSKMLGVSIRVPEAAIARLVSEGLVIARRRHGCVVADHGKRPDWRGHVLVIVPDCDACYYSNVQLGCVRARLSAAGYLVSSMTVLHGKGVKNRFVYDLAPLEFALRQSVDLAVLIFNYRRMSIARTVVQSGVPFMEFADAPVTRIRGCAGSVSLDTTTALSRLVAQCRAANVRSLMRVRAYEGNFDAPILSRLPGIKFSDWMIRGDIARYGTNEGMVRGAMDAFAQRFKSKGRSWLPDLLYFSDDHVTSGALTAMLAAGIRVPEDVRVVTMANWGLGPVYPISLTRLEMNPFEHGEALAQMALDYLLKRVPQGCRVVQLKYVEGDSFPK